MFNLIETQQALKGLPLPDVMKYANGNNPTVPSYLALSELQRRKQIEDTAGAFYGQQPTVKEQIESGLTALPQGQVNPTQAPQGVNPAAMPPQLAPSPTAPPPMVNPTAAPAGMQPNAAPPVPKMAEGGLSQLPLPHMFRQTSYADGGIVHFDGGGMGIDQSTTGDKAPGYGLTVGNIWDVMKALGGENEWQRAERFKRNKIQYEPPEGFDKEGLPIKAKPPAYADSDAAEQADRMTGNKVLPTAVPANPNKQASNTSSAMVNQNPAKPPAMAEFKSQLDTSQMGKVQTPEQVYADRQKLNELMGVSNDPLKEARERTAKLEAKYAKDSEDDSRRGLMSILSGYAKAGSEHPERGFGYAAAGGSESGAKFDKEMTELRNNQMKEITNIKNLQDKEDDARKRGDVKGVEDAIAKQKDAQFKLYELKNQEQTSAATWQNAQTNAAKLPIEQQQANAQMLIAQRGHAPNAIQSLEALYERNPDLAKMYMGQGKVGTMTLEEAYKAVATDPRNMGLTDAEKQKKATELHRWAAGQNAPKTMSMADVKTTAKNSGKSEQEVMDMAKKNGYTIQ
jgi:hypothetical protein